MVVDCLKPSNYVELAQPQGGLVSGTAPAPLPVYQPIPSQASLSKNMQAVDHMALEGTDQEVVGFKTASQGELIALIPKAEEMELIVSEQVEMFNAKPVEEEVVFKQTEVKVTAKQDEEWEVNKEADEEVLVEHVEEFDMSVENFEYDQDTGQFSSQDEPVEFASPQLREKVLAKMFPASAVGEGSNLPSTPALSKGLGPSAVLLQPLHPRHQERRLTFAHIKATLEVKSLGRPTKWTRQLLLSHLVAAFDRPRRGISWADFSPEEKLACFDMVDWASTCPLDPPSRSLMFQPEEDPWSNWA